MPKTPKKSLTEKTHRKPGVPSTAKPLSESLTQTERSEEAALIKYLNDEVSSIGSTGWNPKTKRVELDLEMNQHLEKLLDELHLKEA